MRETHHRALREYVEACLAPMGLTHWTVTVSDEWLDEEGTLAKVEWDKNRPEATMRFAEMIQVATPDELRRTVAHELTHLHHSGVDDSVADLGSNLRGTLRNFFGAVYEREVERFVEAMEPVVARLLPEFGGW